MLHNKLTVQQYISYYCIMTEQYMIDVVVLEYDYI